ARRVLGAGTASLNGVPMKTRMVAAVAAILAGMAQALAADLPANGQSTELAGPEQKLIGAWQGRIGCDGRLVIRADGGYELLDYGPAPYDSAGTWKVRWDVLPPRLILTCNRSDVEDEVGTSREVKLIKLDSRRLEFEYESKTEGHYTRERQ